MASSNDSERQGCGCLIFFGLILMFFGTIIWFGAPVLFVCGALLVTVGLVFSGLRR